MKLLGIKAGKYLVDLNYLQNYMRIISKKETAMQEMMTTDNETELLSPSRRTAIINYRPTQSVNSSEVDNTEPQYLLRCPAVGSGAAFGGAYAFHVNFPLRAIRYSIFAVDKNFVFGEVLQLRLVFSAANRFMFTSTNAGGGGADPTVGAAAWANANPITLQGTTLFLSVETDADIIQALKAQIQQKGFSFPIPFVNAMKQNIQGGSQTMTIRYNRGHGATIKKVIVSAFSNTESGCTTLDCANMIPSQAGGWYAPQMLADGQSNPAFANNANGAATIVSIVSSVGTAQQATGSSNAGANPVVAGFAGNSNTKVTSYYTALNTQRLQEINLDCTLNQDYLYHKKMLRNSVYQNVDMYRYTWFHCDDWSGQDAALAQDSVRSQDNVLTGISLEGSELRWDMNALTINANTPTLNWYAYGCCQKFMSVTQNQIEVV